MVLKAGSSWTLRRLIERRLGVIDGGVEGRDLDVVETLAREA